MPAHRFHQTERQVAALPSTGCGATAGEGESLAELWERAESHDRHHLNIEPALYQLWLDTAIATARDFDHAWDERVEGAWRKILGYVVGRMIKHY